MANRWLKIVSILLISTVYLISFSHVGVMAFDAFLNKGSLKPGTQIASIQIENMTRNQAEKKLEENLAAWFKEENLQLLINGEKIVVNEFFFTIDIPATIEQANNGKGNGFVVQINQDVYEADLKSVLQDQYEAIDHNLLQSTLINSLNKMTNEKQYFTVEAFMRDDVESIAAENTLAAPFNQDDVQKVLSALGTVEVPAQSQVSLLELIGDSKLPQEGLDIVSSAIYKTILLTNFVIVERQTSESLPEHIELGYEALIETDSSDLKWFNPNETDYTLTFQLMNGSLNVKVNGAPFLQNYRVKFEDKTSYSPKTIVRYTSLLDEGKEDVKQAGKEGLLVKVFREVYDANDVFVESEQIAEDFYPPTHKIIETGLINRMVENATEIVDEGSSQSIEEDTTNRSTTGSEQNESSDEQVSESDGNQTSQTETSNTQRDGLWETPTKDALEK